MEITRLIFRQNLIMLLYMAIGYLLYKKELLTKHGSAEIGKLLLYVIMPVSILRSYLRDFSAAMLRALLISFGASLGALLISILVSRFVFRKGAAIHQFGAAFSNAGFIGIPLVQMTLGDEAVFYAASFVALLNILQWTYGVFIITEDRSAISFKKILTNPIVISLAIGIGLFLLPINLPDPLPAVGDILASMNAPLAMIVLGTYLAQIPLKSFFSDVQSYSCSVVRLLLIPAITILWLSVLPAQYAEIQMATLLVAAAPVGTNVAIFAQLYGQKYTNAVKDVCLSTIFSIITVPLMAGLAYKIW